MKRKISLSIFFFCLIVFLLVIPFLKQTRAQTVYVIKGEDWSFPSWVKISPYAGRYWIYNAPINSISRLTEIINEFKDEGRLPPKNASEIEPHFAITIMFNWSDVNPSPGSYNWNVIDSKITEIENLATDIRPYVGFTLWPWYNTTSRVPGWVSLSNCMSGDPAAITPWKPGCTFENDIEDYIIALGNRYKNHPRLVSAEIRAPFSSNTGGEWHLIGIDNPYWNYDEFKAWSHQFYNTWANAFSGQENKLAMMNSIWGGEEWGVTDKRGNPYGIGLVNYGYLLGFGQRDGMPSPTNMVVNLGYKDIYPNNQTNKTSDYYIVFDENHPSVDNSRFFGSEITEFSTDIKSGVSWADDTDVRYLAVRFKHGVLYTLSVFRNWLSYSEGHLKGLIAKNTSDPYYNEVLYDNQLGLYHWSMMEAGKTVYDSPDAWSWPYELFTPHHCTLENCQTGNCCRAYCPEEKVINNYFERWLHQKDVAGDGITVRTDKPALIFGDNESLHSRSKYFTCPNDPSPIQYKDYTARRTNTSSGQNYMYFDVDDRFIGTQNDYTGGVQVKVTYLDDFSGQWRLEYDSAGGTKQTNWVQNTNRSTNDYTDWYTATFNLDTSNPVFLNQLSGNTDFRIYNGGNNDLTVGFVRVIKTDPPSGQPSPSPNTCPADLTGDNQINQDDLKQVLLQIFQPCLNCQQDLVKDNLINSLDLGFVIKDWGSCE